MVTHAKTKQTLIEVRAGIGVEVFLCLVRAQRRAITWCLIFFVIFAHSLRILLLWDSSMSIHSCLLVPCTPPYSICISYCLVLDLYTGKWLYGVSLYIYRCFLYISYEYEAAILIKSSDWSDCSTPSFFPFRSRFLWFFIIYLGRAGTFIQLAFLLGGSLYMLAYKSPP